MLLNKYCEKRMRNFKRICGFSRLCGLGIIISEKIIWEVIKEMFGSWEKSWELGIGKDLTKYSRFFESESKERVFFEYLLGSSNY